MMRAVLVLSVLHLVIGVSLIVAGERIWPIFIEPQPASPVAGEPNRHYIRAMLGIAAVVAGIGGLLLIRYI